MFVYKNWLTILIGFYAVDSGFQGLNSRFFFSETWISDSIVSGIPDSTLWIPDYRGF